MQFSSLIGHSAELVRIMWKSPQPPDQIAAEYLRTRKYIGSKERKAISELSFACLRMYGSLAEHYTSYLQGETSPVPTEVFCIIATLLHYPEHAHVQRLLFTASGGEKDVQKEIESILIDKYEVSSSLATDIRMYVESIPHIDESSHHGFLQPWIYDCWKQHYGEQTTTALTTSLLQPAPLDARVNAPSLTRNELVEQLHQHQFACTATNYSPIGVRFTDRVNLLQSDIYRNGAIEIQDEGSQLVGFALAPKSDWSILDACAGAGGKSLQLALLQKDSGEIVSSDVEYKRLKELHHRAKRAGFNSITTTVFPSLSEIQKQDLEQMFDAVLIDAPCSGMGTVRRNPLPKWRLTPQQLQRITAKQQTIIQEYSRYVKPGGILLYVTCSLMPQENEDIITQFMQANPEFKPSSLTDAFAQHNITIPQCTNNEYCCTFTPSTHNTDGFFVARLQRTH